MEIRNFYAIIFMKIVCILLIICMYTDLFSAMSGIVNFTLIQLLVKIAYPFLFTCASFFFFRDIDFSLPLSNVQNKKRLMKYVTNIVKLYFIWTIIYLPLNIMNWIEEGFTFTHLIYYVRDIILLGSYTHLWIFPALFFSVLLVYYLLQRFKTSEIFILSLICYLFGMLINVYGAFLLEIPVLAPVIDLYQNIFTTSVNGLFYAFIFVFLGMQLSRKRIPLRISNIVIRLFIFIILYVMEVSLLSWLGYVNNNTQMYLTLIPLIYFIFLLLMQFQNDKQTKLILSFARLLYLICFYVMNFCRQWKVLSEHYFICLFIILSISSIISLIILKYANKYGKLKVLYTC